MDKFPVNMLAHSMDNINKTLALIEQFKNMFDSENPVLSKSFSSAYHLENEAGEIHYQIFMETKASEKIDSIFQSLNHDDKDHASRIRKYMDLHGIELIPLKELLIR